jgi:hypothetical protein
VSDLGAGVERVVRRSVRIALPLLLLAGPAVAADLFGPSPYAAPLAPLPPEAPPALRYFPRGDGSESQMVAPPLPRRVVARCTPRRAPVPTNAPDDPSYVGSPYGLGHPSYYGFTPPPGIDDPYGRSLLPYCP